MKQSVHHFMTVAIIFLAFEAGFAQQLTVSSPACDNEDFETGIAGVLSDSTAMQGWLAYRLIYPQNFNLNCAAMTNTLLARNNPTHTALMSEPNGFVDSLIGPSYPIYSVFGSGASNGGTSYNPGIPEMKGDNFLRLNRATNKSGIYEIIEKTFTITQANALFRLAYLPVVHTGADCCTAPSIQIKFFAAASGTAALQCPSYSLVIPQNTFTSCSDTTGAIAINSSTYITAYYHKWRIMAADLSPYIGTTITCKIGSFYCGYSGCPKYAYAYLDAQCSPMEILVNNTPFPAHTNSVTFTGCGITTVTVVAPPDFSEYQWDGPASFSSTLATITTSAAGVYTLNITAAGTCSVITKYVNVILYPAASASISASASVACKGTPVQFSASGLSTYSWNVPGNTSSLTVTASNTTTYIVNGLDTNGCAGTASLVLNVNTCAGIHSINNNNTIEIYPNPAIGQFIVLLRGTGSGTLTLRNSIGESVLKLGLREAENIIQVQHLPKGVYFYTVKLNDNREYNGKLLIE